MIKPCIVIRVLQLKLDIFITLLWTENVFRVCCQVEKSSQQAIGYQKEIKKTLGKTSETDAYLKFEMTSYVKCQTDL